MALEVLTWTITALGAAAFWLVLHHPLGWVLALAREVGFLTYGLVTSQWAFVVAAAIYGSIFWRDWLRDDRRVRVTCQVCGHRAPRATMELVEGSDRWTCPKAAHAQRPLEAPRTA